MCNCFMENIFKNLTGPILRLFRLGTKLEQSYVIKCLVANKGKSCEIYRRMYNVNRKACFSQIFSDALGIGIPHRSWVEKKVNGVKPHWFSVKKNFRAHYSVKNVMLAIFCDIKGTTSLNFFKKRCIYQQRFWLPIPSTKRILSFERHS